MVSNNSAVAKTLLSNEAFWQEHIVSLRNSCLSRAEYCRNNNLMYHQLEYQERKLRNNTTHKSLALLPVKLATHEDVVHHNDTNHSDVTNVAALCTLKLKDGHKLKIFDPKVLPLILRALV